MWCYEINLDPVSKANQAVLADNKTSNFHAKGKVWDAITNTVNSVSFFVVAELQLCICVFLVFLQNKCSIV
jgi:hypothetical protein